MPLLWPSWNTAKCYISYWIIGPACHNHSSCMMVLTFVCWCYNTKNISYTFLFFHEYPDGGMLVLAYNMIYGIWLSHIMFHHRVMMVLIVACCLLVLSFNIYIIFEYRLGVNLFVTKRDTPQYLGQMKLDLHENFSECEHWSWKCTHVNVRLRNIF